MTENAENEAGRSNGADRSQGGRAGFAARMRPALSALGFGRRETPEIGKGGAYDIGSEEFRKACALLPDGRVFIVPAYNSGAVAAELVQLRARYDLPEEREQVPAELDDVAVLHGMSAQGVVSRTPTDGQLRLQALLRDAAKLQASDIKLKAEGTYGVARIKCGSGEHTHGPQWQAKAVEQAVNWCYGLRDGGDGKAGMVEGVPAGFSIGQGGMPEGMPPEIGAFRGQIAWHGDMQRFLNLRLLPKPDPSTYADLVGLGLEEDVLEALAEERRSESGLVIVGGSTGDGKSTTLVRHLQRLYEERGRGISIATLEDPIEYVIREDGITQIAVPPGKTPAERSANWAEALMVFVRINPDVGMVSEIRSAADVNEVLHFVSSGHKVYTTVHSSSANGVLFRLVSLGVLPTELSGPDMVNLVMNQKLLPVLCDGCAEPLFGPALARVEEWLGQDPLGDVAPRIAPRRRNPAGCPQCLAPYAGLSGAPLKTARAAWAGYRGRKATGEFIRVDTKYRRLLEKRDALGAWEHWLARPEDGGMGGVPLATRIRRLVAAGVTDFEHVTNERLPEPRAAIAGPASPAGQEDGEAAS